MRGRSLLRETPSQSLCAFCAHRLGAARQPSHVQRRFLQSSRTSLKPPAEAATLREDAGDPIRAVNVGSGPQTNVRPGLGPTSSWGRPAFGSGIPPAKPAPTASWGRPHGGSNSSGNQISSAAPQSIPKSRFGDLLPHEQRAREAMLAQQVRNQQREVDIHAGAGPQSSRASRPIPRTVAERREIARARLSKQKVREEWEKNPERFKRDHRPSRQIVTGNGPPTRSIDDNAKLPQWSSLKRRGEDARYEGRSPSGGQVPRLRGERFTEGRAQREEQALVAQYTPLNRRVEEPNGSFGQAQSTRSWSPMNRQAETSSEFPDRGLRIRRPSFAATGPESTIGSSDKGLKIRRPFIDTASSSQHIELDRKVQVATETSPRQSPSSDFRATSKYVASPVGSKEETEQAKSAVREFADTEEVEDAEEVEGRSDLRRKPSRFNEKAVYDDEPRGKDRDKARRRQQFIEDDEEDERERAEALAKRELKRQRKAEKAARKAAEPTSILLPEFISVSNLAMGLKVKMDDFTEKLTELGFDEMGHDHILNAEIAGLIAGEYNYEAIIDKGDSEDLKARAPAEDPSILPPRPPVVTIMGHVDHGKTTLLDWLRKSSVAATEHGGITQHIGAFSVPMPSGKIITFLDTPGHAAFLSMRQRGANVTDIVILVVAADDSVKPQTIEAIKHAQTAKVPIIVAINKIDKEDSNVEKVKQDLARHGVDVEDYGGDTQVVCVSGKTGQGMDELESAAVALSEILDMRAEKDGPAEGWVLEASIKSMGKVATVLVRRGTMRPGDFIVAGKTWARIRCLRNEAGVEIEEAGPGMPVEIDGWRDQPLAGDEVLQAIDEGKAKSVVDYRLEKEERNKLAEDMDVINENRKAEQDKRDREKAEALAAKEALAKDEEVTEKVHEKPPTGAKEIFFIVKGDVSGSVEAVIDSISAIGNAEVRPHILRSGVGQLGEFDIEHAAAAKGHLINFNTPVDPNIAQLAAHARVSILDHNIIYRLVDDVKAELSKHLAPTISHRVLGEAEISEIFQITVKGRLQKPIAGSKVRNGMISKNARVRVMRGGEKVFDGSLQSLKSVKKDVQEMKKGSECGIGFDGWFDFKVGDHVQSYEEISEKRYL